MIFASFVFLFWFMPLFLAVYWPLPLRWKNLILTLFSYVFYGWWRPDLSILMLATTAMDWWCGLRMDALPDRARRRRWLILSVVSNLLLLGWFKYANLFADTLNWALVGTGNEPFLWRHIVLPIGISFYTFQSMSYTIDVWRGEVRATRSLADFACFVAMFPQLVAGPIVRYRDVAAEVQSRRHVPREIGAGVFLFMIGFCKKVLLADNVARLCDPVFQWQEIALVPAWTAMLAYALQIYFDFSAYSDMAMGLGLFLGFHFPPNFDSPYRAQSITEFWRRWHLSLSTWLRDYLYIPLGGNRHGPLRTYRNLLLTMLLGGLWHGASWTFALWGLWHGLLLALERRFEGAPWRGLPAPLRVACTFVAVLLGWALFRAPNLTVLGRILSGMAGLEGVGRQVVPTINGVDAYAALAVGTVIAFLVPANSQRLVARFHPLVMAATLVAFVVAVCHLLGTDYSPFIYFQF